MALIEHPVISPFAPFALRGSVDAQTLAQVRAQLLAYAATSEGDVVCDCSELEHIDASGQSMLLDLHDDLAAYGRRLRLVNTPAPAIPEID